MATESCTAKPKAGAPAEGNGGSLRRRLQGATGFSGNPPSGRRLAARPSGGSAAKWRQFEAFTRKSCRASMKWLDAILLPHRRRQPHSGANFQRQDRRTDCPNLQGRPREDEAGGQQRGGGRAGAAERNGSPDRRLQRGTTFRPWQAGAVPGCVRGNRARREHHAGRDLLPIGEGNRILAQISNGKIDELIAQTYKGDHEKMKAGRSTTSR